MKLPEVEYEAPTTVAEAVDLLAEHGDEASVLAGGQSLIPLLALRLARPAVLIDINGIDELAGVSGDTPAEPIVRELLAKSVDRLHMLCATLLHRNYPRLTKPPRCTTHFCSMPSILVCSLAGSARPWCTLAAPGPH